MKRNYIQPATQVTHIAPISILMASGNAFHISSNTPLDFATGGANAGGGV